MCYADARMGKIMSIGTIILRAIALGLFFVLVDYYFITGGLY